MKVSFAFDTGSVDLWKILLEMYHVSLISQIPNFEAYLNHLICLHDLGSGLGHKRQEEEEGAAHQSSPGITSKYRNTRLVLCIRLPPHNMVFDSECMLTDPVSMLERCEREKKEAMLERHQHVDRWVTTCQTAPFTVSSAVCCAHHPVA